MNAINLDVCNNILTIFTKGEKMAGLTIRDLRKSYGALEAIHGVDVAVQQ
jgi:hypothetical protein